MRALRPADSGLHEPNRPVVGWAQHHICILLRSIVPQGRHLPLLAVPPQEPPPPVGMVFLRWWRSDSKSFHC
jgi:hypothetical protein